MAYKLTVNGDREDLPNCELSTLQGAVGGYIEIVPTRDGRLLVCNEEGKLKGLPVNWKATELTRGILAAEDLVVGDCVIADKVEIT